MPDDWGQFEAVHPATAALARLQSRGAVVTNGYRTEDDVDRLRREGYTPAANGAHNRGDGVDLVPGGQFKSLGQLRGFAAREFGPDATVQIHNGTHVHIAVPGWHDAPDTTRANAWDEFDEVAPAPKRSAPVGHAPASLTGDLHDADTFRLSSGDNGRLFGVDAFELNQRGLSPTGQFVPLGTEARDFMGRNISSDTPVTFTGQSTYGRPVITLGQPGSDPAVSLLRHGYGLAEPQYLRGDPRFHDYMEAERLARFTRQGAHADTYQTPQSFRQGKPDPWAKPELSTNGKGDVVFWDDPTPFQGLRPEIAKGYQDIWLDPNSKPEDMLAYAQANGFLENLDPEQVRDRYRYRDEVLKKNPKTPIDATITYLKKPRLQTDVGDGAAGAAVRGFADPINVLDEFGAIADSVVPHSRDFDGPRENIWSSNRRFGDIYNDNLELNRSILDYDETHHPYARFGGQMSSALVVPTVSVEGLTARVTEKALERGMSEFAAQQVAKRAVAQRLAAAGGIEGAAAGAGAGEDARSRVTGAALGGAGGAALGAVAPTIIDAGVAAGKRGISALGRLRTREAAAEAGDIPPEMVDVGPRTRSANMDAEEGPSIASEPLQARGPAGPLADAEMGRGGLHDTGPQPEDFAPAAGRMGPEDVVPIPGNRVESMEEAGRANPGRFVDVEAPDEFAELEVRTVRTQRGKEVKFRGPVDAVSFLRLQGGLKDYKGELAHLGIDSNKPRDFNRQEWRLGPILSKDGMSLDEAGEKLWDAGYVSDRPTVAEVLDILGQGYNGKQLYHPSDLNEIAAFRSAQAERGRVETTFPPLTEERGQPASLEDMAANQPPTTAYEDLPGLVDKVGNINLKNIRNAGDISRAMRRLEDEFSMGAPSPVSHAETEALAREMGMSAKDLLASREGRAFNHAEATAARALLAKSYQETVDLAKRAYGGTDEDKLLFQKAVANLAAIHNKVSGLTREAGRALSAFRIPVDNKTLSGKALKELLEENGGTKNADELAGAILDLERDGVNPSGITRFAVQAVKPKWSDKALALWMFSLLSGPKTHAVNIVSNTLTALGQLPEHATAAALGSGRAAINRLRGRQTDDRVLFSELGPRSYGLLQGAKEGLLSAKTALKTGETSDSISKLEMGRQQEAFSGVPGHIIHAPTRLLSAEDEFFKSIARRMETNALAVRQARSEGLKGEALANRIADLSANPTDDMVDKAFDYARYLTFQRPLGEKGQALMNLVGKAKIMRIPLPFVRTPTNLLKFAVERSPAAPILREVREDFKAGGARRDLALAKMMLGSGFGMAVSEMVSNGFITGGGPADQNKLRQLRADGWQPYSFKIGNRYISYQRLDPLATTMGVFADFVDLQSAMTEKQREHMATLLTTSIIQNLGNKTWLSGLSDAFEVYSDPQRHAEPYLHRLAASAVPSAVAQTAQTMDPTLRQAKTYMDAIRARIPGASESLLPKRDVYGREIQREGGASNIISPFATSTRKNDSVVNAVLESGASLDLPNRQIKGKALSDRDYDRYQQLAGKYFYDDIAELIRDPDYASMSPEDRRSEIESAKKNARADARYDLFGDDSDEE